MSKWLWENKPLEEPMEDKFGFVYRITCLIPLEDGQYPFYIGQKSFWSTRTKVLSKKAAEEAYSGKGRKSKKAKVTKESDWKSYISSSNKLKEMILDLGQENFKFEILEFAENKSTLTYLEAKWIISEGALVKNHAINEWLKLTLIGKNIKNGDEII